MTAKAPQSSSSYTADSAAVYEIFHPGIGRRISFRPVTLEEDFERLFDWQHQTHVIPFWNLNISREAYRAHLEAFLADTHQTLYIGELDGVPMSYWEAYWCDRDIIGKYYDALPGDQGIHLLIGPPEYLGKGYALPLLQAMTAFQFQRGETDKIIAEPDARNSKMIHVFEQCGFVFQKHVDLPDKTGALMFCERSRFDRSWEHE
ncbi:GNAT family N-acetyltransferase [Paenibacillus mucilaginosus]|uniref:Lysine N-acyltransferase MbtK n=2 Tax=Paenibacillus mucilaginosus TaxID=61624 RepID=H6NMA0_9BACL|nr:GNAT family N-acetyltransferase [Paenibacillus mucilaginosus]AFC33262.1 GCN5-related N-acetyltransferase [Paenibacillus mucilaginosus 3016]AFH65576.1 acetyltransferase [Paenibacillus mucilaginosus K02]MCG7215318.1 acetyltransferase [Paenibacillus mucilaginosus]WDM26981.1 acetyltransferase [Paenibacillus mucilaginosus]WFA21685.1 N-acetyltransferase [Paenibacillus mucilaginosus]